jgi:hypothetical protein
MNVEELAGGLRYTMLALGVLFLGVDLRVGVDLTRWFLRRRKTVVVWAAPRPPYYGVNLAIGVMLGFLLFANAFLASRTPPVLPHPAASIFGVLMMFLYYGYLLPLSTRIQRGLYEDGIWTDTGFMRYQDIGGLSWKEGQWPTLVLASRLRTVARRLTVPGPALGEVRHVLRDKIAEHSIEFTGPGIHLGSRDTRESV